MKDRLGALAIATLGMMVASGLSAQTGSATAPSGRSGGNATAIGSTATGAAVPGSGANDRAIPSRDRPSAMADALPKLDRADQKFVEEAAAGGLKEIEFGRIAADKANDPVVKQFGERMVRDHGDANKKLMEVAQARGVVTPPKLGSSDQRMLDKLAKMSGDKFDRAYLDAMVKDHQRDIKDIRKELKSGKDAEVKKFAEDTLPLLEDHLKRAQDMQSKVKGGVYTRDEYERSRL